MLQLNCIDLVTSIAHCHLWLVELATLLPHFTLGVVLVKEYLKLTRYVYVVLFIVNSWILYWDLISHQK